MNGPMTARGVTGSITYDGRFVTITRSGFLARTTSGKGERRIPLTSIQAVQWKPPGAFVNGFISFTVAGAIEKNRGFGKATIDAAKDENAVVVTQKQAPEMLAIRDAIEEAIAGHHGLGVTNGTVSTQQGSPSLSDELQKLGGLRDSGVLTDAEFEAAKRRIINQ